MSLSTGLRPLMMVARTLPGQLNLDFIKIFLKSIFLFSDITSRRLTELLEVTGSKSERQHLEIERWHFAKCQTNLIWTFLSNFYCLDENWASGAQTQIQIPSESCKQDWEIWPLRDARGWHPYQGSLGWVKLTETYLKTLIILNGKLDWSFLIQCMVKPEVLQFDSLS